MTGEGWRRRGEQKREKKDTRSGLAGAKKVAFHSVDDESGKVRV